MACSRQEIGERGQHFFAPLDKPLCMTRPLMLAAILASGLAALAAPAHAESRWAVAASDGARWPEAALPVTVHLVIGDEVEVLATAGALTRVRKGTDFGWVQTGLLSAVAPASSEPVGETLPFAPVP